jgi:(1->4)-alpha-D-glucan 1-alpha-D-glucosylmutase
MKPRSRIPRATYRLQLNRNFTFAQASAIVPYLSALGISHCYISPCLKARPGSMHGYDIVDHNSFNPEIGSAEDFDNFVAALHKQGMGLILDIVPNHMGIMGSDNAWWLDVLENGESSAHASFFDIEWHPLKDELDGKVLVPVLHDHYGAVLENGELKLVFHRDRGEFDVSYYDHRFPVDPREYPRILQRCANTLAAESTEQNPDLPEFQSLITAFGHLPSRQEVSSDRVAERNRDKEIHKRRLAELSARSPDLVACILASVDVINGNTADPASFEELHELIKAQAFRLANWRVAADDINYRRFFDSNDLAGLRMESETVFEATHNFVLRLIEDGKVDGLRIDHPDGLYDPAQYFERLRERIEITASNSNHAGSNPHFIVIEKILTGSERLPKWPVCGTTGYDFSNLVNGIFVGSSTEMQLERIYRNFLGHEIDIDDLLYRCRKLIIRFPLASEVNVLANRLIGIALSKRRTCDFTLNGLRDALTEVVAGFPVYRTYVTASGVSGIDIRYLQMAIAAAKRRNPAADFSILDFIGEVVLTTIAEGQAPAYQDAVTTFAMKFQQFTSPVMAKGVEDTAFYRYNRLVSLNDVGSDLHRFGTTTAAFHLANEERKRDWPHTMLATSTHDSKRSEDVRARINVLSEIPELWRLRVRDWKRLNRKHKRIVRDQPAPSANDEYLLYQTLLGAWPLEPLTDKNDWMAFSERIDAYMLKAVREAKESTSWINRNAEYESAVSFFVRTLLTPDIENRFLPDFVPFQGLVSDIGRWNSVAQTLLKLTCPGVPDIYQGNDLWDFSLVDPDNRRPVDYQLRQQTLDSIMARGKAPSVDHIRNLLETPQDGRIKLYLIWKALCVRQQQPDLFRRGEYIPVAVAGSKANHVVAFIRKREIANVLVVVPRQIASLLSDIDQFAIGPRVWGDTHLLLPNYCEKYRNVFTGENLKVEKINDYARLDVSQVLAEFPVALCLPN